MKEKYNRFTTFTDPNRTTRTKICSVQGCGNVIYQWLSKWGWLNRCHHCAAAEWESIRQSIAWTQGGSDAED